MKPLTQTPEIKKREFGRLPDGRMVHEYILDNGAGITLGVLNLGGIVTAIHAPDRNGHQANLVLGFDSLLPYVENKLYFGIIAGRYANRIAGGRFEIDGEAYQLDTNDGPNTLHGGLFGFGTQWWDIKPEAASDEGISLQLSRVSEDGESGFPGQLTVVVRYTLTKKNAWRIDYSATTDHNTVVNLTQHAYFNLAGSGSALEQRLTIAASRFLPVNKLKIPMNIANVGGTAFDFRSPMRIGERIRNPDPQLRTTGGYDHNWVLDRPHADEVVFAARLEDDISGRIMEIETTEPGLQFYSGNSLDGSHVGLGGAPYWQGDGICLETQHFPDSPNRQEFPSTILRPGEVFASKTIYRFSAL